MSVGQDRSDYQPNNRLHPLHMGDPFWNTSEAFSHRVHVGSKNVLKRNVRRWMYATAGLKAVWYAVSTLPCSRGWDILLKDTSWESNHPLSCLHVPPAIASNIKQINQTSTPLCELFSQKFSESSLILTKKIEWWKWLSINNLIIFFLKER